MGRFDRKFGGGGRSERRSEPVEVKHVRALRTAGKALIVAVVDPKTPEAPVPQKAEVMLPISEIDDTSKVKKPGDRGVLIIPAWLALDRGLIEEEDLES